MDCTIFTSRAHGIPKGSDRESLNNDVSISFRYRRSATLQNEHLSAAKAGITVQSVKRAVRETLDALKAVRCMISLANKRINTSKNTRKEQRSKMNKTQEYFFGI